MDLVEDLPRPHHQSSQSFAQAAALMSQLSDVVARRRDRAQPGDSPAPAKADGTDIRFTNVDAADGLPDAARTATHQQLGDEAATDAAQISATPAPLSAQSAIGDAVSADLGAADAHTTLATDAREAVGLANGAFLTVAARRGAGVTASPATSAASTQARPSRSH